MKIFSTWQDKKDGIIKCQTKENIYCENLLECCEGLTNNDTEELQLQADRNLTKLIKEANNGRTKRKHN